MKISQTITYRLIYILMLSGLFSFKSIGQTDLAELTVSVRETEQLVVQNVTYSDSFGVVSNFQVVELQFSLEVSFHSNPQSEYFVSHNSLNAITQTSYLTPSRVYLPTYELKQSVFSATDLGFESKMIQPIPKVEDLQRFVLVRVNLFKNH